MNIAAQRYLCSLAVLLFACTSSYGAVVGSAVGPTVADDVNVTSLTIGAPAGFSRPIPNGNWVEFTNNSSNFSDGFGLMARDGGLEAEDIVDASPSVQLMDDSVSVFVTDNFGIVAEDDFDNFFAVTDTVNGDTTNDQGTEASLFTATWQFDITGASGGLSVSVDAAAMGDFEAFPNDQLDFEYSFDGVNYTELIRSGVAGSDFEDFINGDGFAEGIDLTIVDDPETPDVNEAQDIDTLLATRPDVVYTLDNGLQVAYNDPLTLNGEALSNEFETISVNIGEASGTDLYIRFLGNTGSGSEVFAFRNLIVEDGGETPLFGDYNDDGTVDAADYTLWRDGGPLANEQANPGVVSADDYTVWADNYGNTNIVNSASIPEPTAAVLAMLALAGLATRRNG